ncbi:MAG TPA: hypothetical protein VJV79_34520 [Polyangiaceae bacterium]|nr:hypothetical protein [Polyangiaceae bacterium]
MFFDEPQKTLYAFTKPEHPAHPAVVNRRVVERATTVDVDQIGYFAGNEAAFAKLFQAFQHENVRMRERMRRQAEGRK